MSVLIVVRVMMVVLVGSVPVDWSVSPKALLRYGELKSQIVLIRLFSFFDLIVFITFDFGSKLLGLNSGGNFITLSGFCSMQKP